MRCLRGRRPADFDDRGQFADSIGIHCYSCPTTLEACREFGKPVLIVVRGRTRPSDVVGWIVENDVKVLNVAGNRDPKSPGIGLRVERFLGRVFRRLADEGMVGTKSC